MGIKRGHEAAASDETKKTDITEDEAALYDRQIRLWGLESQKRLRNANVLLIGLNGLGAEVAKNIALAGVKSITLLDEKKLEPNDHVSQFLLHDAKEEQSRSEGSRPNVQILNPNVEVVSEKGALCEKSDTFFSKFHVVCATDCAPEELHRLNKICREREIHFFCGDTWGFYGYCFVDLGTFTYLPKTVKTPDVEDIQMEPEFKKQRTEKLGTMKFSSLERALSFKSGKSGIGLHKKISKMFFLVHILLKFRELHKRYPLPQQQQSDIEELKSIRKSVMERLGFEENKVDDKDLGDLFGEISPVCAIVGGVLAQEVIKSVCADQEPIQNFFLFDGDRSLGVVENVG